MSKKVHKVKRWDTATPICQFCQKVMTDRHLLSVTYKNGKRGALPMCGPCIAALDAVGEDVANAWLAHMAVRLPDGHVSAEKAPV